MAENPPYEDLVQRVKELEDSERKYRHLFETAMVGIYRTTIEDGRFLEANEALAKMLGYESVDILLEEYFTSERYADPKRREELISRLTSEGKVDGFEIEMLRVDGSSAQIALNATIYPDEGYIEGVIIDITKRKEAEKALRSSEEKYRLLIENATDAVYIAQDGFIKFANPKAEEMTGLSLAQLCEIPFVELIHPEDRDMVLERHRKRLKGEVVPDIYSFRIMSRSGRELSVELNTVLMTWESKPATLNFLRDITEQKRMEKKLLQAQKMEAIGTLAGGVAHDFNNLLMAIQGRTSILMMDKDPSDRDLEHLKQIEKHIESGADLTGQLLGFAQGGKYEVKALDVNALIEESSAIYMRTRRDIIFNMRFQEDVWLVEADKGQIAQVLMNLFLNAFEAMPEGGNLYLETENVVLDEGYVKSFSVTPGRYVKISVTDSGLGMDRGTLEKVFDPFFTSKEMGRGAGLGLASVYGIIKNHHGFINTYSEKGEGTTFNIYMPASTKDMVKKEEPAEGNLKGNETVLFVDDEEMITEIAGDILKALGYQVMIARNGKEAIDLYERMREQIDVVILDMIMPETSGSETFDRLKEIDPLIKVLLSSGYSINGQATEILNRGCSGFIQKPFRMAELSRKLREILDKK